jgi:hypothetical protein
MRCTRRSHGRSRARHVRRYLDHLLKVAARKADQAGVVRIVRQALAVMGERVEQLAEWRCDRLLVRQTVEHRALTAAGVGTTSRHVGRLVPIQHIAGRSQIAGVAQPPLEFSQHLLGGATVARRLGCGHSLSGCGLLPANLLHVSSASSRAGVISGKSPKRAPVTRRPAGLTARS